MKITIDLKDVHFQTAVTEAVRGKIQELCEAAMLDRVDAAIQRVLGSIDAKLEKQLALRLDEAMKGRAWGSPMTLSDDIKKLAQEKITQVIEAEFKKRFK